MEKRYELEELLKNNPYPGRGIVVGNSEDGKHRVIAYFIMGRSENSRNRIFSFTDDGIQTEPYDVEKVEDPSLIIYHPVRRVGNIWVTTNGDQTDTIVEGLKEGKSFSESLKSRTFEPDAPNYTPRISNILYEDGSCEFSILKALDEQGKECGRFTYSYPKQNGLGHFLHTYKEDGNPLPSFEGEPECVEIQGDIDEFTRLVWNSLNQENRISLYVAFIQEDGRYEERIVNKNE